MKIREIIQTLFPTRTWKLAAIIAGGVLCGLGSYTLYASRAWTYLSDDPATCVNCHIMGPYYATWNHSSHSRNATCNDCHVPHENAVKKWFFKGMDGMRHASVFMMRGEPQVIQAIDESAEVIMNNCIRCHTQLNTEFVNTGRIDHEMANGGRRESLLGLPSRGAARGYEQPVFHTERVGALSEVRIAGLVERYAK